MIISEHDFAVFSGQEAKLSNARCSGICKDFAKNGHLNALNYSLLSVVNNVQESATFILTNY